MKRTTALALAAAGGALLWRRARASDDPGILGPQAVRDLYDRLAPVYDALAPGYALLGGGAYRHQAVGALALRPSDTVVDLACGTGANFPHLARAVGAEGRVIGVDLSPGMLAQARQRIEDEGWDNIELVVADVREFAFPEPVHGVLSTFGIEMVPEHEAVVRRAVAALAPGGRIAVGGLRHPERWPEWTVRLGAFVNRPFGVSRAYEEVQPWRSVFAYTQRVSYDEFLLGAAYLAVGETPAVS
ncbi:MAG: methyltransferase domain-containing protein [Bacteroidota bacterium]